MIDHAIIVFCVSLAAAFLIAVFVNAWKADSFAKWDTVRKVGSLDIVKMVSFLPLVALVLSDYLPTVEEAATRISSFLHTTHAPFSGAFRLQLYTLLCSLLLFAIATLIYWLKCPDIVQKYDTYISYVITERQVYDLNDHTLIYAEYKRRYPSLPELSPSNRVLVIKEGAAEEETYPDEESQKVSQMRYMYQRLSSSSPRWARLAVGLYSLGIAGVVAPSVKHVLEIGIQAAGSFYK